MGLAQARLTYYTKICMLNYFTREMQGIMWGEPELTVAWHCSLRIRYERRCVMRQSFTLVMAVILGSQTSFVSLQPCQASVDSLSRWVALITSLQPALSGESAAN